MHQIRQNARPTIRERREKREPRSERESLDRAARPTIAPRRSQSRPSDNRIARRSTSGALPTSGARPTSGVIVIVDRAARRTSVLPDLMHFLVKCLNEPNTKINFP